MDITVKIKDNSGKVLIANNYTINKEGDLEAAVQETTSVFRKTHPKLIWDWTLSVSKADQPLR